MTGRDVTTARTPLEEARMREDNALHDILRRVDEILWDHVDTKTAARLRPWFKDRIADHAAYRAEARALADTNPANVDRAMEILKEERKKLEIA